MNNPRSIVIVPVLALISVGVRAAPVFTDWTAFDSTTDIAQGTLVGTGVTLTGTALQSANTNGTSTLFSTSQFTPALPASDYVEFVSFASTPISSYQITFTQAVTNPLLHLASLASVLTFSGINPELVSGDANFLVSGNTVSGQIGTSDSNGTVRLPGTYSSISFTANFVGFVAGSRDGIAIQVGAEPRTPSVPEPASLALLLVAAAGGIAGSRVHRHRR